jgi:hypothetical protein
MNRVLSSCLLLGILAALLTWLQWPGSDPIADVEPAAPDLSVPPMAANLAPASGSVVARAAEPAEDRSQLLELPDGTFVPTLNGAVDTAPLARYWGPSPFSPIVGIDSAGGVDWYRHADGSMSTTVMVWRRDKGRMEAMTRVAHPGPEPAATSR